MQDGEVRWRRTNEQRVRGLIGHDRRLPYQTRFPRRRDARVSGRGRWAARSGEHGKRILAALRERLQFLEPEGLEVLRKAPILECLNAGACRAHGNRGSESSAERLRQFDGARVFERHDVGAQPSFTAGLRVQLTQQIEITGDVRPPIRDQHGIRAGHDLDPRRLACDLGEKRDTFVRAHELERHDLRDETQRRWVGELLSDANGTG